MKKTAYWLRIVYWISDVCASDLGAREAAIEKQLGRKDCLVCNAEGDQPNGQPASLLGRVDAIVKGVDAVLQAGLEPWQLLRSVDGGGGQRRADRGQVGGCREGIGLGVAAHHILLLPAAEHQDPAGGAEAFAQGGRNDGPGSQFVRQLAARKTLALCAEDRDPVGVVDVEEEVVAFLKTHQRLERCHTTHGVDRS